MELGPVVTWETASVSVEAWRQNKGLCRYRIALVINEQTIPHRRLTLSTTSLPGVPCLNFSGSEFSHCMDIAEPEPFPTYKDHVTVAFETSQTCSWCLHEQNTCSATAAKHLHTCNATRTRSSAGEAASFCAML